MLTAVAAMGPAGCAAETRVVKPSRWASLPTGLFADERSRQVARGEHLNSGRGGLSWLGGAASPDGQDGGPGDEGLWSIPLRTFTGAGRHEKANRLINTLRGALPARGLWMEDVNGRMTVHFGRFAGPQSELATDALAQVRKLEFDGETPLADARLMPIGGGTRPPSDPLDARGYVGYFTLQVAFFNDTGSDDRREAAEAYARRMRADKVEAYFYHGPRHSLVTVGMFTRDEAFDPQPHPLSPGATIDAYSAPVAALQKRFPYNLPNGKAPQTDTDKARLAESGLVQIF